MIDSAPAASPTSKEEYPQEDRGCRKPNNQKDTGDSTLVVKEPMSQHMSTLRHNLTPSDLDSLRS